MPMCPEWLWASLVKKTTGVQFPPSAPYGLEVSMIACMFRTHED